MADEITILESDGSFRFSLFFIFPISTPVQTGVPTSTNVIPTPATVDGLSVLPLTAQKVLDPTEIVAFDDGTSAWREVPFRKDEGLTNAQLLTKARGLYAEELADFNHWYAQTYLHSGQRFDA